MLGSMVYPESGGIREKGLQLGGILIPSRA
jgi:hypothetical protein